MSRRRAAESTHTLRTSLLDTGGRVVVDHAHASNLQQHLFSFGRAADSATGCSQHPPAGCRASETESGLTMAWIESHQALVRHPKLTALAAELGIHKGMAFWHLHCLWYWALDYASDGDTSRYGPAVIADGAGWTGDADLFVQSLKEAHWLDDDGKLHDWDEYAGRLCDARSRNRERMKSARANARLGLCGATVPTNPTNPTLPTNGGGGKVENGKPDIPWLR